MTNKIYKILVSSCLSGEKCGFDGTSYGEYSYYRKLEQLENVELIKFCPEDFSFGTPRSLPDIHGGDGFSVLEGKAKVLSENNDDLTKGMIKGAEKMLELAKLHIIDLAILMDMSAACGVQTISDGCRLDEDRKYRKGPGVSAALLIKNGFKVICQRDYKSIELLFQKLNPDYEIDTEKVDHHETKWYQDYFR